MQTLVETKLQDTKNEGKEFPIFIEHLRKKFGNNEVLKDINLKVRKGESVVVLGKSGTGKSVLIKCIVGLIHPDDGVLNILHKDIPSLNEEELDEVRRKIGFLFQSAALYDSMTVRENLEFPLRRSSDYKDKPHLTDMVKEALDNVGLLKAIDKMPSELSGGMRKRVGLARTLIMQPEIMLYDEPTTGLDPVTSAEISELILKTQEKYKTTSIIITHDMPCAKITGDRLVILKEGRYVAEGTFEDLEKSEDTWISSFFKMSK